MYNLVQDTLNFRVLNPLPVLQTSNSNKLVHGRLVYNLYKYTCLVPGIQVNQICTPVRPKKVANFGCFMAEGTIRVLLQSNSQKVNGIFWIRIRL